MLLRVFLLLDHLASGARGAAVRSELLAARNAACGPPPLSSLPPPPSSFPSLDRIASSSPSCRRSLFFSSLPPSPPLISTAHFSRCPHANSPPLRSRPPGATAQCGPAAPQHMRPGHMARPGRGSPFGAPRAPPYLSARSRAAPPAPPFGASRAAFD